MRRISRRVLRVDSLGRLLSVAVERLTDFEDGTVAEEQATLVACCPACDRPYSKAEEIRPTCGACLRATCVACHARCAVCGMSLCHRCRVGFAEKGLSVCAACQTALERRLERADRMATERDTLQRQLAVCNTQMRLLQLIMHSGGTVSQWVTEIVQARLARRLHHLERQIDEDLGHGRQLLD